MTTSLRPPVRRSVIVRSDVEHTFAVFVDEIGTWWPLHSHSRGGDRARDVAVERRVGGRVHETWDDGTECEWGRVLVWDEPHRFAMTWTNSAGPTEVELTFAVLGPSLTRVSVEHRGWETLTEEQVRQDCARPGGYSSGAYGTGWALILERFTTRVEAP